MIVHEEFKLDIQAPWGGKCAFCDARAEHGLRVTNDHDELVFRADDLCALHMLGFVMQALTEGPNSLKGKVA